MNTTHLPGRIVASLLAIVVCLGVVTVAWVDDTLFGGATRTRVPSADGLEDRLAAGDWQMRSTDALLDVIMAGVAWQTTMQQAQLGSLTAAPAALDQLDIAAQSLRDEIAGPLLHPDDQTDRTDIHSALALIDNGVAAQRTAVDSRDPVAFVSAGAGIAQAFDGIANIYGRGRR